LPEIKGKALNLKSTKEKMDDQVNNRNYINSKTNHNDKQNTNTVIIKMTIPDTSKSMEAVMQNEIEKPEKAENFGVRNS